MNVSSPLMLASIPHSKLYFLFWVFWHRVGWSYSAWVPLFVIWIYLTYSLKMLQRESWKYIFVDHLCDRFCSLILLSQLSVPVNIKPLRLLFILWRFLIILTRNIRETNHLYSIIYCQIGCFESHFIWLQYYITVTKKYIIHDLLSRFTLKCSRSLVVVLYPLLLCFFLLSIISSK